MQTEGSEALTLARVGDAAGVSKPVVYDHFTTRHGLLITASLTIAVRRW